MEQRPLFRGGPPVSVLGFGAWPIGGGMGHVEKADAIATVQAAIDHGLTFIDTAQYYLTSEALIGEALKGGYRERAFLATKVSGDFSRAGILAALDDSLRALRVDYVDLYQIHWWDDAYPIEETMTTLAEVQQTGKARFIGVSNYNKPQMAHALSIAPYQTNQIVYNIFDREIEADDLPYCQEQGIGILAHSVLAKGLLGGRYTPSTRFPADDERSRMKRFQGQAFTRYLAVAEQLKDIAADNSLTLIQLAIAWVLRTPAVCCALVGPKSVAQVADYAGAAGVTLSAETLARIEAALTGLQPETLF